MKSNKDAIGGSRYEWINVGGIDSPFIGGKPVYRSNNQINDTIRCEYVQETTTGGDDGTTTETRTPQKVTLIGVTVSRSDIPFDGEIYDLTLKESGLSYIISGILKDPFEMVTGLSLTKDGDPLSKVTNITARQYRQGGKGYYDLSEYRSDLTKKITYSLHFQGGASTHTYTINVQDNWNNDNKFVRDFNYHVKGGQ